MYVLKIKYLLSRKKKYVPVEYRNQLESASVAQAWHNLSFDEDKRASQKVLVVKNLSANAGDLRDSSLIPGSGRSSVGGHSNSRQYSYLENPTDRAWQATVHKVAKSWTLLQWLSTRIKITVDQSPLDKFLCVIMNYHNDIGEKNNWLLFEGSPFSCSIVSDSLWPHGLQHARFPGLSPTPGVYSNSRPSSQLCHPTISSSVIPFSSRLQSFPASGSFQMS